MTEQLRTLLQSCELLQPMRVQTDLSGARVPTCAVTRKSKELLGEDVLGQRRWAEHFVFQTRQLGGGETDRQRAYTLLQQLSDWLQQPQRLDWSFGATVTALVPGMPSLQEAYDDGTAVWSMSIRLDRNEETKGSASYGN